MADADEACVASHAEQLQKLGIHPLVGRQDNVKTLKRWMVESDGRFDAIIDDGGHSNKMISTTFKVLWHHVKPGGMYFIEDMQVGRDVDYDDDTGGDGVFSDVIQSWIEQLVIAPRHSGREVQWNATAANRHARIARSRYPLPQNIAFITCQEEACVIAKKRIK